MSTTLTPRTSAPRPDLPFQHANPHIKAYDPNKPPAVKYQIITREGNDIIVGRIKVGTPEGHAFVLRRFDTNAISLTTMFRAAFPSAPEDAEKAECAWIKTNYDISAANGGTGENASKLRLAGTWVPPEVALTVADSYSLGPTVRPLIAAIPEGSEYRKSTKANGQTSSPVAVSPAAKRRREASPAAAALPISPPQTGLRRSTRQKSPAPKAVLAATTAKPKAKKTQIVTQITTDEAPPDEEEADVPGPDMEADFAEQKALIEKLKADQAAAGVDTTQSRGDKRKTAEEPPITLNLDREPEVGERAIVTNRRVLQGIQMTPERRSIAWGAGLFSATLGAFYFATQYSPQVAQYLASL